jgi:hypothetical protein
MKPLLLLLFIISTSSLSFSQEITINESIIEHYALNSIDIFREFLSIPNDANNREDIHKNIHWCRKAFEARGFTTTEISTLSVPLLLASKETKNAEKTVLIYLQIDG